MLEWWNGMECQIRKHDAFQFEIKLAYPLNRANLEDRYRIEVFLFLPYQLGINESRYTREEFYRDLRGYVRFKTPPITLAELVAEDMETSPIRRLRRWGDEARAGAGWDEARTVYEIKVLADIIRARVRDEGRRIRALIEKPGAADWTAARERTARLAQEMAAALAATRALPEHWAGVAVPARVVKAAEWADEYAGIEVEECLLRVIEAAQGRGGGAAEEDICRTLAAAARAEEQYRVRCGWQCAGRSAARQGERRLYRQSLLKKFCAGALFLSVTQRPGDKRFRQIMYGIAAGVAMAFASVVALIAGRHWPQQSTAFIVALIVAYIFKDRIKDMVRDYGMRRASKWASDRQSELVDQQSGRKIGETHERFGWQEPRAMPAELTGARAPRSGLDRAVSEGVERVIRYAKDVRIDTKLVYEHHVRSLAINDILRINVGNWLDWTDNARKDLLCLSETDRVARRSAARTYPVDMVIRMTGENGEGKIIQGARLYLTRGGIERLRRRPAPPSAQ